MKVILIEDIKGTGKKGQTVEVKEGYARNFLLPRRLAIPASEGNVKRFQHIIKDIEKRREREIKAAQDIKTKLEEITLSIKKKAGVDGKLFGSVTHKDIAEEIEKTFSISVDKKMVKIEDPIKNTGSHTVDIYLEEGVHATVKVEVEQEA